MFVTWRYRKRKSLIQWFNPRAWIIFYVVATVSVAVAAGLGVAAVSRVAVDWEVEARRLVIVRAKAMSLSRELFVLYRKNARLSAAASVFLAMARA